MENKIRKIPSEIGTKLNSNTNLGREEEKGMKH